MFGNTLRQKDEMMLSRRHDENVVYEQQQAAASKPHNQGAKGLAPKTPANKPPKTPAAGRNKNDENTTLNLAQGGTKGTQLNRSAFVTPANPRPRAVLGNKTTNAKALQTPAPLQVKDKGKESSGPSSNKATSPRLRRSKIKVHESTSVDNDVLSQDLEEREIEYMPPREVPLPDIDEDIWPQHRDLSLLDGKNLTRGWWSEYAPNRHKTEDDPELSDYDENIRQCEERQKQEEDAKKSKAMSLTSKTINRVPLRSAPTTKKSKDAASALSSRCTKPTMTKFAAPTIARKVRHSATTVTKPILDHGNPRFAAAKAASNSTIGYSKGRTVSVQGRPLTDIHKQSDSSEQTTKGRNTLDDLLSLGGIDIADDSDNFGLAGVADTRNLLTQDGEEEVFQLDAVQDC